VTANFDGLARWYQYLELSSFGAALERARFEHIHQLAGCRNILLLGDGDGRFLKHLLNQSPDCTIRSIDASAEMMRVAAARLSPAERARVTFEHADALDATLPSFAYDGVATLFFLDCFTDQEAARLVSRISNALKPGGIWLFADFSIPERGVRRAIARAITAALYAFFRRTTRISARHLPESERLISEAGCTLIAADTLAFGLLRSVAFRR
jgi:ubiquinone/menaquinone biosynthesis C-methylase UbiE